MHDGKNVLWIVDVKDSEHQRWLPYAVGITPEVNANLEDKAAIDLLPPAVAVTFKSQGAAESFYEGSDVAFPPGPSHRLDAQALTFRLMQMTKKGDLALPKFFIKIDFLDTIEQAFDQWRIPKR
jgi:hypothetical protein